MYARYILYIFLLSISPLICQAKPIHYKNLEETGPDQRRDLSIPMSRIILNFYDFNGKKKAAEYSNSPYLPLNAAFLSTGKNEISRSPRSRFSRAVPRLLTLQEITNQGYVPAKSYQTKWTPDQLPFQAEFPGGAVTGTDFLFDENTISRRILFKQKTGKYLVSGEYKGNLKFEGNCIIINNGYIHYAVSTNIPISNFSKDSTRWYFTVDPGNLKKQTLYIAVHFSDNENKVTNIREKILPALEPDMVKAALKKRKTYWINYLRQIPRPHNFTLSSVTCDAGTSEKLEQAYYKAWIFIAQNLLPPDPVHFSYPQICTGKASLWDEGEESAPFSAAWESLLGIQLYAYIDPNIAWNAFKGLLSLVDENGMLGGESLPSRKAQTASVLYQLTGDTVALSEVYPALKRYMQWRMEITHWVYGDILPSEHYKDAEFAFSALTDIEHMESISGILKIQGETSYWNLQQREFGQKCRTWFWETPQSLPVQVYDTNSQKRITGNTVWVTTALYVKNLLDDDYLNSVMKRFYKEYNPENRFSGFDIPKYPDVSYTVYGLINHHFLKEASGVIESTLRDITKAKAFFAEQYIGENFQPDGVRPSLFGACSIVDFTWLLNGYKYDRGIPSSVILNTKNKGLSNIKIHNNKYTLRIGPTHTIYWGKSNSTKKRMFGTGILPVY